MRLAVFLLAGGILAFAQLAPRMNRVSLARMESTLESALAGGEHPCEIFNNVNGVYIDGFGVVFTSTVAILRTPTDNPFRRLTHKDISDVHERKVAALPLLKLKMRDMLFTVAASPALEAVRPQEQVVCSVTLFYLKWEDQTGLPKQIVVQGEKQKLLDIQAGRISRDQFDTFVTMQEL